MARHPIVEEDLRDIVARVGSVLDRLEGRSLVITGATGLLMSYLTETIAWLNETRFAQPCRLTAIVRQCPALDGPLEHLHRARGIRFRAADARFVPDDLHEADYLVLAATKGSPRHYLADPVGTLELNGAGLGRWLERASEIGSRGILFVSSGEVYGSPEPEAVPTPETYAGRCDPTSPRAVYAEAKRYGEALCLAHQRTRGVPVAIVRPFQVFGPGIRDDDGRALPEFLYAAARGGPVKLSSAGTARRTFLYLSDAAVAFWHVLCGAAPGSIYNVGSATPELTIRELATRVAALAGPSCRVEMPAAPEANAAPERAVPDVRRLHQDFGFRPRYDVDGLLERTFAWVRSSAHA